MKLQAALATLLAVTPSVLANADVYNITGTDILNFALNLECLEAEFYSWAVYKEGVADRLEGLSDPNFDHEPLQVRIAVSTGYFSKPHVQQALHGTKELAQEIADDEIAHVKFLRTALGDDAIECPKMDIGPAFAAAVQAASNGSFPETFEFNAYANDRTFLHSAFVFEDVGVTAYAGAVPALAALVESGIVGAAAQILSAEAYHAGAVRDRLIVLDAADYPAGTFGGTEQSITVIIDLISKLRDAVDGDTDLDQGIGYGGDGFPEAEAPEGAPEDGNDSGTQAASEMPPANWNYIPTNEANGLVFARTVSQVLNIVYLGADKEKGGFFPNGINGAFGPESMTREEIDAALAALGERIAAGDSECSGSAAATDPRVDSTTDGEEDDDNAAPSAPRGVAAAAAGAAALLAAVVFG